MIANRPRQATLLVLLLCIISVTQIAGCSMTPLKKIPVDTSARVGIVIGDFSDKLTHTHIGTTVFANFDDQYPLGFDIRKYVGDRAEQKLVQMGYSAKMLALDAAEYKTLLGTIRTSQWDSTDSLAPDAAATLSSLGSKYGVDLILVYFSSKGTVYLGPASADAGDYGLFSRSALNLDIFMGYSFLHFLAFHVIPPALNADGWYLGNPPIKDFPMPGDFRHLSDEELDIVRGTIKQRIDAFVDATARNGVGSTPPVELKGARLR